MTIDKKVESDNTDMDVMTDDEVESENTDMGVVTVTRKLKLKILTWRLCLTMRLRETWSLWLTIRPGKSGES